MPEPTLRIAKPEDFERLVAHLDLVFGTAPSEEGRAEFKQWLEFDRTVLAEDDDTIVGSAATNTYQMVVPGGDTVPVGGLTIVAVRPTHRRSGLLRRMMRHHLEDVRDHGEAGAILFASEASIYGRFGFGMTAAEGEVSLLRSHGQFRDDVPPPTGKVRLLDLATAGPSMRAVLAEATAEVPGTVVLREQDWVRRMTDLPSRREGFTPWLVAVYERDGKPRGFARYRQKGAWGEGGPEGKVMVHMVHATDGEAFAAVWRYLLDLDLAVSYEASNRPVPDPLRLLLADPRRLIEKATDGLWLRPMDVPALLTARRYRTAGSLVLEVRDESFDSGGRFRLEGGPDGANCVPTDVAADVTLSLEHLGAIYLGGNSVSRLAWLGLIGGDASAVRRADDMFSWPITPHNTLHF